MRSTVLPARKVRLASGKAIENLDGAFCVTAEVERGCHTQPRGHIGRVSIEYLPVGGDGVIVEGPVAEGGGEVETGCGQCRVQFDCGAKLGNCVLNGSLATLDDAKVVVDLRGFGRIRAEGERLLIVDPRRREISEARLGDGEPDQLAAVLWIGGAQSLEVFDGPLEIGKCQSGTGPRSQGVAVIRLPIEDIRINSHRVLEIAALLGDVSQEDGGFRHVGFQRQSCGELGC